MRVQAEPFDVGQELARLTAGNTGIGGVASFTGLVREFAGGRRLTSMTLEHYPGMTEKALQEIVDQACERWEVIACQVIHRVGELQAGEQIVYVGVAGTHRGEAFAAAEFIMDYLKTQAPFWKKEQTPQGARWVDARVSDDQALARWQ